ncbi:MAG: DUF1015 family protein [Methanomicrobiales archaeon]|nr:DUF1015 family protein [Methanomicrobiales archaeon]
MATISPFTAVRPRPDLARDVAAPPYDVVSTHEAWDCIRRHPLSFLSVSRSDALLPQHSPSDPEVYRVARERFLQMIREKVLVRDDRPSFSLYRVEHEGMAFTGLVCTVEVEEYREGLIRRHELTRYDKEQDRTRHIESVNAHTGLVFLVYRDTSGIGETVESLVRSRTDPVARVSTPSGAVHQVFRVDDPARISALQDLFLPVNRLYIADGHHRAASAVNVALSRIAEGRATTESGRFMAVLFAHDRVRIHGYTRLAMDLGGATPEGFLAQVAGRFRVEGAPRPDPGAREFRPMGKPDARTHVVHLYLAGQWYELTRRVPAAPPGAPPPLDVTSLQDEILGPILGITDPRGDPRLQYIAGTIPFSALEAMVDDGRFAAAFAMQPAAIGTVMAVADAGGIMPPKSTWFEPKLCSGLIVHTLD